MPLEPGQKLAHYLIERQIGQGGMGEVFLAQDTRLDRKVALKVLPPETAASATRLERFQREAKAVAALNHPHIVTIYSVEEVAGTHFLTMELVEGESLDHGLPPGGLPLARVFDIGIALADALATAHEKGIIHRDLKPANVMLTPDGRVKVLDFGLAKLALGAGEGGPAPGGAGASSVPTEMAARDQSLTGAGMVLGTVPYMSPEQVGGETVDARTDIFSLGIVLYELATGRRPFAGKNQAETISSILRDTPQPVGEARQDAPRHLSRIIEHCLQKEPRDRFQTARDVFNELRALSKEVDSGAPMEQHDSPAPVSVFPEGTPGSSPSSTTGSPPASGAMAGAQGWPPWIWAGGGAALVAVTVAAFLLGTIRRDGPALSPNEIAAVGVSSVAVLPFHNLSADADNDYFSDGMTEEIISKLSRIGDLEVAARSSVASFTDRTRDVKQISNDLNVRYLLDGSVRRAGDRVRVSAQLVDGKTGRILWSEDFEGSLEDIFAMQEQTALQIAEQLNIELSPEEERDVQKRSTENAAAYDAYLRGMNLSREWAVRAKLEQAIAQFELALKLDPDYAAALAGLAFVEGDMYRTFDSSEERIQRAEGFARRAAELDPMMPDASHALAMIAGNRFDYTRAAELLRETVRLAPKQPRYWDNLSWALAYKTPPDGRGAVDAALQAIKLQPHFPGAYYHLGRGLIAMGRHEEAREAFETMIEQEPDFTVRESAMAQYYLAIGNYAKALATIEEDDAKDTAIGRYYRAAILAASGSTDEALAALEGALEQGYRDFGTLETSPHFASLRDNSRYQDLLNRYRR